MSLEYVFNKGETYSVKSVPLMLAERFIANIEQTDKVVLTDSQAAGYLAQFVIAHSYKLSEPTEQSRFDRYDFLIHGKEVDMKTSLYNAPALIIDANKLEDADVFLLFNTYLGNTVTFIGGTTQARILQNLKIAVLNGKRVIIIPAEELTSIKIDALGVEEYV